MSVHSSFLFSGREKKGKRGEAESWEIDRDRQMFLSLFVCLSKQKTLVNFDVEKKDQSIPWR